MRPERCPECGLPKQYNDHARSWDCPECDDDTLDAMERGDGVPDDNEYDEEARP